MENNTLQLIVGLISPIIATIGTYVVFSNKITKMDTMLSISSKDRIEDRKELKDHSNRLVRLETNFEIIKERTRNIENKVDKLEFKLDETNRKIDKYLPLLEQIPKILQKIS